MRPHINDTTTQPENEQGANFMDLLFFAKDFFPFTHTTTTTDKNSKKKTYFFHIKCRICIELKL